MERYGGAAVRLRIEASFRALPSLIHPSPGHDPITLMFHARPALGASAGTFRFDSTLRSRIHFHSWVQAKAMTIERARPHAVSKTWGIADLRPWSDARQDDGPIGEIWYERPGDATPNSSLLLKLLFTSQPLSIQVHPDDASAHAMGLPNGKTEAWYVLSTTPDAKVALGLKQRLTSQQFRAAVGDGTIRDLVVWHSVSADDVISVPAGTIHSIGAGIIIAEIQQRSDATFRLFDFGRHRALHIESAIAVANTGPADSLVQPDDLVHERTLLVTNSLFRFEKLTLPANSAWSLGAEQETWFLVLKGSAHIESFDIRQGEAIFAQSDHIELCTGPIGLVGLMACTNSGEIPYLTRRIGQPGPTHGQRSPLMQAPSVSPATSILSNGHLDIAQ